jgi:hypothetical protein
LTRGPGLTTLRPMDWLKLVKTLLACLLIPFCLGMLLAIVRVLDQTGTADTFWVAVLAGVACWLVVFLMLPKPMWVYVVGHEATHALWTWLFGGRVKKFKASGRGGRVVITRYNFLIALAPYFFPFYAFLVVAAFGLVQLAGYGGGVRPWFHLLLGAAYAFHVTLTLEILKTRQSDLTDQGIFFSLVIILLGNLSVVLLGLPMLTGKVGLLDALSWWLRETAMLLHRLSNWF